MSGQIWLSLTDSIRFICPCLYRWFMEMFGNLYFTWLNFIKKKLLLYDVCCGLWGGKKAREKVLHHNRPPNLMQHWSNMVMFMVMFQQQCTNIQGERGECGMWRMFQHSLFGSVAPLQPSNKFSWTDNWELHWRQSFLRSPIIPDVTNSDFIHDVDEYLLQLTRSLGWFQNIGDCTVGGLRTFPHLDAFLPARSHRLQKLRDCPSCQGLPPHPSRHCHWRGSNMWPWLLSCHTYTLNRPYLGRSISYSMGVDYYPCFPFQIIGMTISWLSCALIH